MVIADNCQAYWIKSEGEASIKIFPIEPGLHMLTAHDLDDMDSSRIQNNLVAFKATHTPDPEQGKWAEWIDLLANGPGMCFLLPNGFGTVSSSLIALPSVHCQHLKPVWLYTHVPPTIGTFTPVL